jgi:hypothetical protein
MSGVIHVQLLNNGQRRWTDHGLACVIYAFERRSECGYPSTHYANHYANPDHHTQQKTDNR